MTLAFALFLLAAEQVAPGISCRERTFHRGAEGPFAMQILEVDPKDPRVNLLPVRALDRVTGKEIVSSMARRYGAAAAVNGGYFVVRGPYAGASVGVYQLDGRPLSSGAKRTALLLCRETGFVERLEMDVVNFRGRVTAGRAARPITGLNVPRGAGGLVAYSPELGPTTLTAGPGMEVALDAASRVTAVEESGNTAIPRDGRVLSGAGAGAEWLRTHARPGIRLAVRLELNRTAPGCDALDIVGGGPRLVRNGKIAVGSEGFGHAAPRHPRTAVAVTKRGTILFVTVDGRQPSSIGMRLGELAGELLALGALDAMNLDGGGSTTMVVRDRVRNSPSDGAERPVSDGILVFSIAGREQLGALIDRLGADPAHISPGLLPALRQKVRDRADRELRALIERSEGEGLSTAAARLLREGLHGIAAPAR